MDNQRLIIFVVFAVASFFLYDAWYKDAHAPVAAPAMTQGAPGSFDVPAASPALTAQTSLPRANAGAPADAVTAPHDTGAAGDAAAETLHVQTDEFIAEISTYGGELRTLELRNHRDALDPAKNFVLFEHDTTHTYVAQSGLIGPGLPNHTHLYTAAAHDYVLAPDADRIEVRLIASAAPGLKVSKTYTFHRASYVIDVSYDIENDSAQPVSGMAYFQLVRDGTQGGSTRMAQSYTGVAAYTDKDKFKKTPFTDLDKDAEARKPSYVADAGDGWIAILQHYFLAAWLPPGNTPRELYARKLASGLYAAGVQLPFADIAPGQHAAISAALYAGPQEQDKLSALAPGLDLSVDYGRLTFIAKPLFWFLQWLHHGVGNWGVAIILLTISVKALFYPLSAASYRSMARMRAMAPRMQRLKERYADDRQRLNQAMMELYKTEKINPLGGCLPIIVQIPVFISLYWVLAASVELRHAPFMLWIHDLAQPDPYYVLPVLMGASMLVQASLSPAPPDPVQAKIMKIMPVAFSVFFFFFPAGLVLYWLVNNLLSIAQQWRINSVLARTDAAGARKT